MQTLGKGVHSVAPRGGASFLQALFLAGVLLWPPVGRVSLGAEQNSHPRRARCFFVVNGVDLPLTFPAAGTGRLTLPPFFVVYTVNQAVNFLHRGHIRCGPLWLLFLGLHPATTPQPWQSIRQGACFVSNPATCPAVPRDDARHQCRQNGHERRPRF